MSGINAIIYYGPTIFHDAGWELGESLGGQTIIGLVNVLFTLVAVTVVDRFGRKPMLYFGITGWCGPGRHGGVFALGARIGNWSWPSCSTSRVSPCRWARCPGSLLPRSFRRGSGPRMSVGTFTIWFTNTMVMLVFPTLSVRLGPAGTFALFAVLVAPALLLTWRLIPETKGRSLEEIERSWKSLA